MAYSLTGLVRDPETGRPVLGVRVSSFRLDTFAAGPTAVSSTSTGVVTLTGLTDGVQYAAYADYSGKHVHVPLVWTPSSLASGAYGTATELAAVVSSTASEAAGTSALVARADHVHALTATSIKDADIATDAEIAVSKVAQGSALYLLRTNSGATAPEWFRPPSVRAYNTATQSISNTTETRVLFNNEHWDTDGIHSTSVSTGALTVPIPGMWLVGAQVQWEANATGGRDVRVYHSPTGKIVAYATIPAPSASYNPGMNVSAIMSCAANDVFELFVYQDSGGALNILGASGEYHQCEFWAHWIGPA